MNQTAVETHAPIANRQIAEELITGLHRIMILTTAAVTKIVRQSLEEIGMTFDDNAALKETTIARVREQLHDAGGTNWDPSPDVIAGLILLLQIAKKNYVPDFGGDWFDENKDKTVEDLIDHLHDNQVSLD